MQQITEGDACFFHNATSSIKVITYENLLSYPTFSHNVDSYYKTKQKVNLAFVHNKNFVNTHIKL